MNNRKEMYTHDKESLDFRQGYRAGMEEALNQVKVLIKTLVDSKEINGACWVELARDWIDDELSMYEVGDEE